MSYTVTRIADVGGDILAIEATDDDTGQAYGATGWTSFAWNFYLPQSIDPETGNRADQWEDPIGSGNWTSGARRATEEELLAYALQRLSEAGQPCHEDPHVLYAA